MDDEDHQVQFSQDYVNQSHTYPAAVSTLQENEYVVIRGRPCEIVEISSFESGQYGDEMIQIVGNDLFTGKQLEMYEPSNHQADVPNVNYTEYQFVWLQNLSYSMTQRVNPRFSFITSCILMMDFFTC